MGKIGGKIFPMQDGLFKGDKIGKDFPPYQGKNAGKSLPRTGRQEETELEGGL